MRTLLRELAKCERMLKLADRLPGDPTMAASVTSYNPTKTKTPANPATPTSPPQNPATPASPPKNPAPAVSKPSFDRPAEQWYSDPTFQSNALWGAGLGLAAGLGGYALTGRKGTLAPWLLGGLGVGAGIGGMAGYGGWQKARDQWEQYDNAQQENAQTPAPGGQTKANAQATNSAQATAQQKNTQTTTPGGQTKANAQTTTNKPQTVAQKYPYAPESIRSRTTDVKAQRTNILRSNEPIDLNALPALDLSWDAARSPEANEYRLQHDLMINDAKRKNLEFERRYESLLDSKYQNKLDALNAERETAYLRNMGVRQYMSDVLVDGYASSGALGAVGNGLWNLVSNYSWLGPSKDQKLRIKLMEQADQNWQKKILQEAGR